MKKYLIAFTAIFSLFIGGCGSIQEENDNTTLDNSSDKAEEAEGGFYELNSVKMSDESKFSEEEWEEILEKIEEGEITLEDE